MSLKNLTRYMCTCVYRPTECQPLKEADKEGNFYLLYTLLLYTVISGLFLPGQWTETYKNVVFIRDVKYSLVTVMVTQKVCLQKMHSATKSLLQWQRKPSCKEANYYKEEKNSDSTAATINILS